MNELLCISLHEDVRRDWDDEEPLLPLLFPDPGVPLLDMLSKLGNLCIFPAGEGVRFWKGSLLFMGIEEISPLPKDSSRLIDSVPGVCSIDGAAVGMKNLAALAGLTDGAVGGWKRFVEATLLPPPLLKVSTYLDLAPIRPRAEY